MGKPHSGRPACSRKLGRGPACLVAGIGQELIRSAIHCGALLVSSDQVVQIAL